MSYRPCALCPTSDLASTSQTARLIPDQSLNQRTRAAMLVPSKMEGMQGLAALAVCPAWQKWPALLWGRATTLQHDIFHAETETKQRIESRLPVGDSLARICGRRVATACGWSNLHIPVRLPSNRKCRHASRNVIGQISCDHGEPQVVLQPSDLCVCAPLFRMTGLLDFIHLDLQ